MRKPISDRIGRLTEHGRVKLLDGSRPDFSKSFHAKGLHGYLGNHPCLGASSLHGSGGAYVGFYNDMYKVETALHFIEDLEVYYPLSDEIVGPVKTFAAIFRHHPVHSQDDFAEDFWKFAQTLHDVDCLTHEYDTSVSSDPTQDNFEFSLVGRAVFTATSHLRSHRHSRISSFPTWAMNQLSQFEELRKTGKFEHWQKTIRSRDSQLDPSGAPNPLLASHGDKSVAIQLAGSMPEKFTFTARKSKVAKSTAFKSLLDRAMREQATEQTLESLRERAKTLQIER